jgi:hypothetical protein
MSTQIEQELADEIIDLKGQIRDLEEDLAKAKRELALSDDGPDPWPIAVAAHDFFREHNATDYPLRCCDSLYLADIMAAIEGAL